MQRLTISLDDDITAAFDELISRRGYTNRSEAFRDLLRKELAANIEQNAAAEGDCVAVVSYAYDHEARQLSQRLTNHQHGHTGLVISTMHVHVDETRCAEAVVLRGPRGDVRHLAENLIAETGIEHGAANFIPLAASEHCAGRHHHEHDHNCDASSHAHSMRPPK